MKTIFKPLIIAAALGAACFSAGGCANDTGTNSHTHSPSQEASSSAASQCGEAVSADGSVRLLTATNPPGTEAMVAGQAAVGEDGVVYIADGDATYPVIWPDGTTLSDDGKTITVPGIAPITIGEPLELGGGYVTDHGCAGEVAKLTGAQMPEGNSAEGQFIIISSGG